MLGLKLIKLLCSDDTVVIRFRKGKIDRARQLLWLSDGQWERIELHLPMDVRGVKRADDRRVGRENISQGGLKNLATIRRFRECESRHAGGLAIGSIKRYPAHYMLKEPDGHCLTRQLQRAVRAPGRGVIMVGAGRVLRARGKDCGVGLVVGLAGTVLLFHNLAGRSIPTTLWGNDLDPNLTVWIVEWGYHTIFQRLAPFDFWNANSYFPHPDSLAFSDSMLSAQLLYAPFRWLGFSPLPALYLTMAGFCVIGAALTDYFLRAYEFNAGERAIVIVAAHFSLPMTAFLTGHYQLFGMQLVPPLLLATHRLLSTWHGRDLVLITTLFCLAGGFATYTVPMVGLVGILVAIAFSGRFIKYRKNSLNIFVALGWKSIAISLAMLGLFFVVQLLPYLSLFGTLPPQPMSETLKYSARPWSILLDASASSFWYKPRQMIYGYGERAAFPGFPLLLLGAIGGIGFLRRVPAARLQGVDKSVIPLATFAVTVFFICWVLSWGPYLSPFPLSDSKLDLPFLALAKLIPGVQNIRAPGRFAQFYGLPLGLMAVVSARYVAAQLRLPAPAIAAVIAVIVLVDQMPQSQTYPFTISHADFFRTAKPLIKEGKPLIVLPITGADHFATWSNRERQLVSSTIHWGKLVTGVGSRDTPEQDELLDLDGQLRRGTGSLANIVAYARRLNISTLVLFPDDYPADVRAKITAQAEELPAHTVLRNSEGLILQLPP